MNTPDIYNNILNTIENQTKFRHFVRASVKKFPTLKGVDDHSVNILLNSIHEMGHRGFQNDVPRIIPSDKLSQRIEETNCVRYLYNFSLDDRREVGCNYTLKLILLKFFKMESFGLTIVKLDENNDYELIVTKNGIDLCLKLLRMYNL